jgi:hypothetical protein
MGADEKKMLKNLVLLKGLTVKKSSDILRLNYVNARAVISKEKALMRQGKSNYHQTLLVGSRFKAKNPKDIINAFQEISTNLAHKLDQEGLQSRTLPPLPNRDSAFFNLNKISDEPEVVLKFQFGPYNKLGQPLTTCKAEAECTCGVPSPLQRKVTVGSSDFEGSRSSRTNIDNLVIPSNNYNQYYQTI